MAVDTDEEKKNDSSVLLFITHGIIIKCIQSYDTIVPWDDMYRYVGRRMYWKPLGLDFQNFRLQLAGPHPGQMRWFRTGF